MTSSRQQSEAWMQPFRNILELERANGYNDKAVIGGMDGFVRLWSSSLASFVSKLPANRHLIRPGYASMNSEERAEWASQWLAMLEGNDASAAAKSTDSQTEKTGKANATSLSKAPRQRSTPKSESKDIDLDSPVTALQRVSSTRAAQLGRLDVATLRDLLYLFPRRHLDYSSTVKIAELQYGQEKTVVGRVRDIQTIRSPRSRKPRVEAAIEDETGSVRVTWFGQTYPARVLTQELKLP